MTNAEIIKNVSVAAGLFTEAEAAALIMATGSLPVHTFQEWKRLGYSVKKGEHAAITTNLWKYTTKPSKANREAAEGMTEAEQDAAFGHYYMAAAYLFTVAQVHKIGATSPQQ